MSYSSGNLSKLRFIHQIVFILCLILFGYSSTFAQQESEHETSSESVHKSTASKHNSKESEFARFEIPITYVVESADKGPENVSLTGFVISPTIKISPRVGIISAFSYRHSSGKEKVSSYEGAGGIELTVLEKGRTKVGFEFELGGVHERSKEAEKEAIISRNQTPFLSKVTKEPLTSTTKSENSVYFFIGGVVDIETSNKHMAFRLIKAGYKPTFFGGHRQNNFEIETGIVFNLGFKKE